MIGGLVAMSLDKSILGQLGRGRRSVIVTGTNGKSTTTRMTAAALATIGQAAPGRRRHSTVATNAEGANMDAGLVAALGSLDLRPVHAGEVFHSGEKARA